MSDTRELQKLRKAHPHGLTPPKLAPFVGVSGRTIARRIDNGELPFRDNGEKLHLVEWPVIELIKRYGLGGVSRMVAAGKL